MELLVLESFVEVIGLEMAEIANRFSHLTLCWLSMIQNWHNKDIVLTCSILSTPLS